MPILDCSVKNCFYNSESRCQLDTIKVDGSHAETTEGTACASFELRKNSEFSNREGHIPDPECSIDCEATKCTYNDNCKCEADHIGIAGNGACECGETECASFFEDR